MMKMLKRLALLLSVAGFVSPAFGQTTVLGPNTTTVSVTAAASMAALPANPTRRAVTICNGGPLITITFTTGLVVPVALTTGYTLPATTAAPANCYTIGTPGGGLGGAAVGAQINVIGSAAGPTVVTFFEYF